MVARPVRAGVRLTDYDANVNRAATVGACNQIYVANVQTRYPLIAGDTFYFTRTSPGAAYAWREAAISA